MRYAYFFLCGCSTCLCRRLKFPDRLLLHMGWHIQIFVLYSCLDFYGLTFLLLSGCHWTMLMQQYSYFFLIPCIWAPAILTLWKRSFLMNLRKNCLDGIWWILGMQALVPFWQSQHFLFAKSLFITGLYLAHATLTVRLFNLTGLACLFAECYVLRIWWRSDHSKT